MRSLKGPKASRIGVSSKLLPTVAGVHFSMMIPLGTVKNERRLTALAAVSAGEANAGTIASNSGNASAVPAPRRNTRRGMDFLNTSMIYRALLIWNGTLLTTPITNDDHR